jgi:hypothetical protein
MGDGYVGNAADSQRIRRLNDKRKEEQKDNEVEPPGWSCATVSTKQKNGQRSLSDITREHVVVPFVRVSEHIYPLRVRLVR